MDDERRGRIDMTLSDLVRRTGFGHRTTLNTGNVVNERTVREPERLV
jgi:hypothetical protein